MYGNADDRDLRIRQRLKLVRLLAHEMGHAVGIDHVGDPEAVMYKLNMGENLTATATDLAELNKVCRAGVFGR